MLVKFMSYCKNCSWNVILGEKPCIFFNNFFLFAQWFRETQSSVLQIVDSSKQYVYKRQRWMPAGALLHHWIPATSPHSIYRWWWRRLWTYIHSWHTRAAKCLLGGWRWTPSSLWPRESVGGKVRIHMQVFKEILFWWENTVFTVFFLFLLFLFTFLCFLWKMMVSNFLHLPLKTN